MSGGGFLGRALAGREGAYFLQQSKNAVGNLVAQQRRNPQQKVLPDSAETRSSPCEPADVLPEILRHSIPLSPPSYSDSSSFAASKWAIRSGDPAYRNDGAFNPLRDYLSLPQVTFGPKRWELPAGANSVLASTANDLRTDKYEHVNPEKLKAAAAGLAQIGKAFVAATVIIFGAATCTLAFAISKLQVQDADDIKVRGQQIFRPKVDVFREQMLPLQAWVESMSRKWHIQGGDEIKEKPIVKELSKLFHDRNP